MNKHCLLLAALLLPGGMQVSAQDENVMVVQAD